MKYVAVFERDADGGLWAYVPDLPGCVSYGETREDAERSIREAVVAHLELMREAGERVPEPGTATALVEAA